MQVSTGRLDLCGREHLHPTRPQRQVPLSPGLRWHKGTSTSDFRRVRSLSWKPKVGTAWEWRVPKIAGVGGCFQQKLTLHPHPTQEQTAGQQGKG